MAPTRAIAILSSYENHPFFFAAICLHNPPNWMVFLGVPWKATPHNHNPFHGGCWYINKISEFLPPRKLRTAFWRLFLTYLSDASILLDGIFPYIFPHNFLQVFGLPLPRCDSMKAPAPAWERGLGCVLKAWEGWWTTRWAYWTSGGNLSAWMSRWKFSGDRVIAKNSQYTTKTGCGKFF